MFNKLKKRIKRALAGFLKEELKEYTDYSMLAFGPLNQEVIINEIRFDTYKMEAIIDIDNQYYSQRGSFLNEDHGPLSAQIDMVKRDFAKQVTDYIHVDIKQLTDPVYFGKAAIRLTLRVQSQK